MKEMNHKLIPLMLCSLFIFSVKTQATEMSNHTTGKIQLRENILADEAVDSRGEKIHHKKIATSGPYSISYISDFKFGTHEIPKKKSSYAALNDEVKSEKNSTGKETPNFIQVSDGSGSSNGWRLKVSADKFQSNTSIIEGVAYEFRHITASPIETDLNQDQKKEAILIPKDSIKIESGKSQEKTIAEVKGMNGQGRWHISFGESLEEGKDAILLHIPKGAVKEAGTYKSTLTWSFENAK